MSCADSTTVSLAEWSAPCRMCGQLLVLLPDRPSPTVKTANGTVCFECYPTFVQGQLAIARAWDVQYTALTTALVAGLPTSTSRRVANLIAEAVLKPADP